MTYKHIHQPLVSFKDDKPVIECKHCGMESEHCHYCCDGSHVDLLEVEVAELKEEIEQLKKTSIKIGKNSKVGNIRIGKT